MPRKPRDIVPGNVYHLISRFVDRDWFINSDVERERYLSLLGRALLNSNWRCLGYAVMSNHVHLNTVAGTDTLGSWVRRVHSPFADSMNREYDRIGPMFVRGPKAYLVPREKLATLLAYIHNNPVRARVVSRAIDSGWTSHRSYVGAAAAPSWLHVNEGLARAGLRATDLDSWVSAGHVESDKTEWEQFEDLALEEAVEPDPTLAIDADDLVNVVAEILGLSVEAVRSRRKQRGHVFARHVIARSGDKIGLSGAAIARALGSSQQCVSKILTHPDRVSDSLIDIVMQRLAGTR